MLTLMLLRHAKAVAHGRGDDISRDLTERGEADAMRLGAHLAERGLLPDIAFVSAAVRTRRTYELFRAGSGGAGAARFEQSLYNATAGELRDLLDIVDPSVGTLMIIGHNPGIMDAAVLLAQDGDPVEVARLSERFPPCGLAILSFAGEDWQDARARGGRLDALLLPEDIAPGRRTGAERS